MSERIWTAGLVVIGDEILSGRTHDKNISQVAEWLQVQNIRLDEVRVVADVQERIVEAVNALRARNDYLSRGCASCSSVCQACRLRTLRNRRPSRCSAGPTCRGRCPPAR